MSKQRVSKASTDNESAARQRFLLLGLRFSILVVVSLFFAGFLLTSFAIKEWQPWFLSLFYVCISLILGRFFLPNRVWLTIAILFYPTYLIGKQWPLLALFSFFCLSVLTLLMGQAWRGRVPLFLTSRGMLSQLASLIPQGKVKIAELGSGTGSVVEAMCLANPEAMIDGYELAWIPRWISYCRFAKQPNIRILNQDFMMTDWSCYDVIYVFQSPLVMEAIWKKALTEMHANSILISNSFEVPGVTATQEFSIAGGRQNKLLMWKMGSYKDHIHGNRRQDKF
ncbi:class I SAM-dependent methyltransferase [Leeia sp. TBRC 13508]|uniref:Class I SAM-dependent methyltransferase n=1 Tax=Leeia speluncae TaxID=2884804 RepID=A0ABS8D5W9_9NEIS|nr:class I SAM-dependent methyltransferase [Leeia speluncae]MCB6183609.1 class I SAM-dependent methyltransferase [Leeia speluncae]